MENVVSDFLSLPVKSGVVWQGGTISFGSLLFADASNQVANEGVNPQPPELPAELENAQMALWVSCETDQVHANPDLEATPLQLLAKTLCEFADVQEVAYRPAHIEVNDRQLAESLRELLGDCGSTVVYEPDTELWYNVREGMAEHFSGIEGKFPPLAESECDDRLIKEYAKAAAAFYRARIWQHLSDLDVLSFQSDEMPANLAFGTVLGAGREEFGIGFYESAKTHWDIYSRRSDIRGLELASLTFNHINDMSPLDIAMWEENNLPLETGEAFPVFLYYSKTGPRLPEPEELKFVTQVLLALSDTSEAEMDRGKWTKTVKVGKSKQAITISLPDLLNPPSHQTWMKRGVAFDRRAMERHHQLVRNFVAENEFSDLEEVNAAIAKRFAGSIDDLEYPNETPRDQATNLCYDAIDAHGRRRIQLARQAAERDPTCTEANNLLAEAAFDTDERIRMFQRSVELGTADVADMLEDPEAVGNFWAITETRPLIRAKSGLAHALAADGQASEAIAENLDILRLNENDNLGIRYDLIPLLLTQNRQAEAIEVLDRYSEKTAQWMYLKAQIEFRRGGPESEQAQVAMQEAFQSNPYVVELLLEPVPPPPVDGYTPGSPEEAVVLIEEQLENWSELEQFLPWMIGLHEQNAQQAAERARQNKLAARRKQRKKAAKRKSARKKKSRK